MNTNKIRNYIFPVIFTSISLIIITVGYYYSSIQKDDSLRINLAGRQRMLCQKITKEILLYRIGKTFPRNIQNSMMIFTETQHSLIKGGWAPFDLESKKLRVLPEVTDQATLDKLIEIKNEWELFEKKINENILTGDKESLTYIIYHNEILLNKIDDAVYTLQLKSEKNIMITRIIIIISFFIIAALLLINLIKKIKDLRYAAERIKELETLLPICSSCKKIRIDNDHPMESKSWATIEDYLHDTNDMLFTHSICPDCIKKLYPEILEELKK